MLQPQAETERHPSTAAPSNGTSHRLATQSLGLLVTLLVVIKRVREQPPELHAGSHVQLPQRRGNVFFCRTGTDMQQLRDVFVRVARSNEFRNLELSRRERGKRIGGALGFDAD